MAETAIVAADIVDFELQKIQQLQAEHNSKIQDIFNRLESNFLNSNHTKNKENQLDIRYRLKMPIAVDAEALWKQNQQTNHNSVWKTALNESIGDDIAFAHKMARFSYSDEQRQQNPDLMHLVDVVTVYNIQDKHYAWVAFEVDISKLSEYNELSAELAQERDRELYMYGKSDIDLNYDIDYILYRASNVSNDNILEKAKFSCSFDTIFPNISCDVKGNVEVTTEQLKTMFEALNIDCDIEKEFKKTKLLGNHKEIQERQ